MGNYVLIGAFVAFTLLLQGNVDASHCELPNSNKTYFDFPKYQLTFADLLGKVIPQGQSHSPEYHEIYSFDFQNPYGLPLLRKVSIRWNVDDFGGLPQFSNNYAGWLPYESRCEAGFIEFNADSTGPKDKWLFKFFVVYPTTQLFYGTSFSSCPERYLINWYCAKEMLYERGGRILGCIDGVRMSIYSPTGLDRLPWHLIVEDMCKNKIPKLDDIRWTFTNEASTECQLDPPGTRRKRSTERRHYL
ncbi:hypothetical protein ACF0H5_022918 [Mactra antiquata]